MSSTAVHCPFCEASIGADAKKCRHCGEWVARDCLHCGTPLRREWAARGICVECQARPRVPMRRSATQLQPIRKFRNRTIAAVTAFFFGGLGIHKFYLGNALAGLVYLLFCWTLIPSLVGMFEGIRYALMNEGEFQRRYAGWIGAAPLDPWA